MRLEYNRMSARKFLADQGADKAHASAIATAALQATADDRLPLRDRHAGARRYDLDDRLDAMDEAKTRATLRAFVALLIVSDSPADAVCAQALLFSCDDGGAPGGMVWSMLNKASRDFKHGPREDSHGRPGA